MLENETGNSAIHAMNKTFSPLPMPKQFYDSTAKPIDEIRQNSYESGWNNWFINFHICCFVMTKFDRKHFCVFFFCSFSSLVHTHYTHSLKLEAWLFSRRLTVTQASNLFSVCGWKMLIIQLVIRPFSPKTYNSIDFFPRSTDAHIIYQQPWSICCAQIYIYLSIFSHKLN